MKNGDVYSIARSLSDMRLLGVSETSGLLPLVPIKIDALCGQAIRGNGDICDPRINHCVDLTGIVVFKWC